MSIVDIAEHKSISELVLTGFVPAVIGLNILIRRLKMWINKNLKSSEPDVKNNPSGIPIIRTAPGDVSPQPGVPGGQREEDEKRYQPKM